MTHFRNRKEANLIVGSVLLIAVMVVVSVVVDAWAGKTSQFAQTEKLTVMEVTFSSGNMTTVVMVNDGQGFSEIAEVWINSAKQTFTSNSTEGFILPKNGIVISIFYTYLNGADYDFKMVSERGTTYLFTATAL